MTPEQEQRLEHIDCTYRNLIEKNVLATLLADVRWMYDTIHEQAVRIAELEAMRSKSVSCTVCDGTGEYPPDSDTKPKYRCGACHGTGKEQ